MQIELFAAAGMPDEIDALVEEEVGTSNYPSVCLSVLIVYLS